MSKWFLEIVQNYDGTYYANMTINGAIVRNLPESVDYDTLKREIRQRTGIEILKRKDLNFQQRGGKKYAYIDATQYREDCRVSLHEMDHGWKPDFSGSRDFREGDRVQISGDSAELWLADYNVRVDTEGTVLETPSPQDKKVFVCIDSIDGDRNVNAFIRKSRIKLLEPSLMSEHPSLDTLLQSASARTNRRNQVTR